MNYHAISYYLGKALQLLVVSMLPPLGISLYHGEQNAVFGFLLAIAAALLLAVILWTAQRFQQRLRGQQEIYVKDGFIVVAMCWLCISIFGALPYYFSGEIPSYIDSLFESISGFTTTGASILTDMEAMSLGLLFWRSFTHWIGGMGVLVFLLAATNSGQSVHVMKAESPGPTPSKLVPRLRQSSMILYGIYIALSLLQTLFLLVGGLPLFDSLCCAMSTAGTGGFFVKNASIAHYGSAYIEIVVTVFMVLFGVNFNIYFFMLVRNFRGILRSEEFRVYLGIFFASSLAIAINLLLHDIYPNIGESLRYAAFQVSSVMTTTGFYSANFDLWPQFSRILLMIIMVIGASAGSTGGGIKVARMIILTKESKRLISSMAHPRSVGIVKLDGKTVSQQVVHHVNSFFFMFCMLIIVLIMILSLENFDGETTVTAVLACVGNVGPGLNIVGPIGNYSSFSALSKLALSVGMLMGRLEIYPILLLMLPRMWRRV